MYLTMKSTTWIDSVVQLLTVIVIFVFVLALAYFASRFAGKFQANIVKRSNIQILEVCRVSNACSIQIVKIADKVIVIGVSKDKVEYIMEIDPEELKDNTLDLKNKGNFKDILSNLKDLKKANEDGKK